MKVISYVMLLCAFQSRAQPSTVQKLSCGDFDAASKASNQLIDLRSFRVYKKGFIKNAKNIDLLVSETEEILKKYYDQKLPLYVYAQNEKTSEEQAQYLNGIGFTQVNYLEGGFENWLTQAKPYVANSSVAGPIRIYSEQNIKNRLREKPYTLIIFTDENQPEFHKIKYDIQTFKNIYPNLTIFWIDPELNQSIANKYQITQPNTYILFGFEQQLWRNEGYTANLAFKL